MSTSGSKKKVPMAPPAGQSANEALERLEIAVSTALAKVVQLEGEVVRIQAQSEALEGLLKGVTSGEGGPREMIEKLQILEEENRDLRRRLEEGREGVDRLLAHVKFLEEQP